MPRIDFEPKPYMEPRITWQELAWQMQNDIVSGNLPLGSKLPYEKDLAQSYGSNRVVLREALAFLRREQMIKTVPDQGRFICKELPPKDRLDYLASLFGSEVDTDQVQRIPKQTDNLSIHEFLRQVEIPFGSNGERRWASLVRSHGGIPAQEVTVNTQIPPLDVAERLEIPNNELTVRHKRRRFVNGIPYDETYSSFPRGIVGELDLRGRQWDISEFERGSKSELTAYQPTPKDIAIFRLDKRTSLMTATTTSYDATERPLRVQEQIAPTDRRTIVIYRRSHFNGKQ